MGCGLHALREAVRIALRAWQARLKRKQEKALKPKLDEIRNSMKSKELSRDEISSRSTTSYMYM